MANYDLEKSWLSNCANDVLRISNEGGFDPLGAKVSALLVHLRDNRFYITVVGEFNRGKSTLVNAFLRADVIPTAIRETTATINIISYAESPTATVVDKEGNRSPLEFTKAALKEYTALSDFDPGTVDHIELEYPAQFLGKDIVLVDTPGVNDINQQRAEITYGLMPLSDAVIFLLDSQKPFTRTEQSFLTDQILKNNIATLFFVVNKSDHLPEEKRASILQDITQKLKATLGTDPAAIHAISSDLAIKGFIEDDRNKLERSGFMEFEKELNAFLTSNERTKSFLRKCQLSLLDLTRAIVGEVELSISQSGKTLDELRQQSEQLRDKEVHLRVQFEEIIKYLDTDEEAVKGRIEVSLGKKFNELEESLLLEIELLPRDITEYSNKLLPFKIRQSGKLWVEQNIDAINDFLRFSLNNAASAFEQHFSKRPVLASLQPAIDSIGPQTLTKIRVDGDEQVKQTEKVATYVGTAIVGGIYALSAIFTGGMSLTLLVPSLIGGNFIGAKYLSPYFTKKKVAEQKEELRIALSSGLRDTRQNMYVQLSEYFTAYYSSLKEQLRNEWESTLKLIKSDIQGRIDNFQKEKDNKASNQARLENTKRHIIQVQLEIQQRVEAKEA